MDVSEESKSNSTMYPLRFKLHPREEASFHSTLDFRMRVLKIPGVDFSISHYASGSDEFITRGSHVAEYCLEMARSNFIVI